MSADEFPDPLAAMDQILRAFVDVAKGMRAYFLALTEEGFTDDQALALAMAYQTAMIQRAAE